jgi:hyperosmotically inducible periplasmic protein
MHGVCHAHFFANRIKEEFLMRKLISAVIIVGVLVGGYYAYTRNWPGTGWVRQRLGLSGDSKTASNVKAALNLSKRASPFNIGVQSQDGIVTLTGQVSSESTKTLAEEIARDTPGVREVKNEIAVDRAAQPESESAHVDDLEIRAAVLEALTHSPELGGKKIDVKVENRMVALSGSVETQAQRNGAEQVARAADGVAGVTNEITVTNPTAPSEPASNPPTDPNADLAKRVKFELYETGAFDTLTINVKAQDGNVTLTGTVRSRAEQVLATFVAQGSPGAKKVVNQLQVASQPAR